MKKITSLLLAGVVMFLAACKTSRQATGSRNDNQIDVTFLQINDVYEIAPLSGGTEGGLARVATLHKTYNQKNPNTFLVIAGDFLSPSVYNSLQYEGKAIRGRQMVDALNAAGLDWATFGNHEFDIKEGELQDRIDESRFRWLSSNAFHKTKYGVTPFQKNGEGIFPQTAVIQVRDADGTEAKIGLLAVTLPFNKADYVSYTNPLQAAKEAYNKLKDSVDAVVAITHQAMEDDETLAREIPGLAVIIGGHEHDGRYAKIGNVPITKALANAKDAYVINLHINTKTHTENVETKKVLLNTAVPLDSATNAVVQKWVRIAQDNYASLGFDANAVVMSKGAPLEGRETEVRSHPTNFTRLIVAAMQATVPQADIAVLNGGSVRVDDVVQLPITQYDILRSLPFGGGIRRADIKGSLVLRMLEAGRKNTGTGGFLQYNDNLRYNEAANTWTLNGEPLDAQKVYSVVMPEFLFSGKEANLDFLVPDNPDVLKAYPVESGKNSPMNDVRLLVIQYLQNHRSEFIKE